MYPTRIEGWETEIPWTLITILLSSPTLTNNVFCSTEQPGSSAMCTILRAKHIVRGFKFCVQNIPEILRSVVTPWVVHKTSGMIPSHTWRGFTLFSFVRWLDPSGWGVWVSSGEERVWADRRLLQGLQKEMQQTLQLGKAQESRGGLGASQSGKLTFVIVALVLWYFLKILQVF